MWIRFLYLCLKEVFVSHKSDIFLTAKVPLRVWLNDLDIYRHVNNGRYFSLMDLGRVPIWGKSTGLDKTLRKNKMYFVVASETITFRKSLTLGNKYAIHSRIRGFDDRSMYLEQRFVVGKEIYARGFVRMKLLRRTGGSVGMAELAEMMNFDLSAHPAPSWAEGWNNFSRLPAVNEAAIADW